MSRLFTIWTLTDSGRIFSLPCSVMVGVFSKAGDGFHKGGLQELEVRDGFEDGMCIVRIVEIDIENRVCYHLASIGSLCIDHALKESSLFQ